MLLMEAGVSYNKQKLHKAGYFRELLATNPDINEGLCRCCEYRDQTGGHVSGWCFSAKFRLARSPIKVSAT
jgi:hypothetical protein